MKPTERARKGTKPGINRRVMLKHSLAWAVAGCGVSRLISATADQSSTLLAWLERHRRPDGGYAWAEQDDSHLTPTFAVIGCYHLLKRLPPQPEKLADFVRTHHPSRLKKLEQEHREFEYQQIQALLWLGADPADFRDQVSAWTKPTVYLKQYEQHGYPIFGHEVTAFTCRKLLGLPLSDLAPSYLEYLDSRRRPNGSFNNTPAADGGEGHVLNTWWGLQALDVLRRSAEKKQETIAWLRACQLPNGGFTYQPKPEFGGIDDAAYTWAAIQSLKMLGAEPADRAGCVRYLSSLAAAEGGFCDRPGWLPNPVATFYALASLESLGGLTPLSAPKQAARPRTVLPESLKVFSIQIEAHGRGSPTEAVDLAAALRIHLWGAKNPVPRWVETAQAIADRKKVPVMFFVSNEEYGTWVNLPGLGTYSHTSDIVTPASSEIGSALSNKGVVSWPEFRRRRLAPLLRGQGRLIWQFGENEELTRIYLDDSLERGGYAAISTFHFGNPDFTNSEPFLQRWRGQLPFVALQDAHGNEPWWFSDMTTGFRTLFLGSAPTWEAWLKALERNWVVAVRHDAVSNFKTWMHAGSPSVLDFVRQNESAWRWWDNPAIERPWVSIAALKPGDEFEVARPEKGVTLRVRCAWENTTQGLPKKAITELISLSLNGARVEPALVAPRAGRGQAFADHYYKYDLPNPTPGKYRATALVRHLQRNLAISRTVEFDC